MKKLLSILLAVGLVMSMVGSAFAGGLPRGFAREISEYSVVNPASTTFAGETIEIFQSVDRILGYTGTVTESGASGGMFSLYDAEDLNATTDATLFAEAELSEENPTVTVWFPYPKRLKNTNLVVRGGTTGFTLCIYYEDNSLKY